MKFSKVTEMDQNNPHNYMGSLMLAQSCDVMHALPARVAPRKQHNEECSLVIGIMTSNIGCAGFQICC